VQLERLRFTLNWHQFEAHLPQGSYKQRIRHKSIWQSFTSKIMEPFCKSIFPIARRDTYATIGRIFEF
jgi:hypothetical protein